MWIQIPGGKTVNTDNIQSAEVQTRVLILRMVAGDQVSTAYDSSADAYAAKAAVDNALLNPTSGSPTMTSISPNTVGPTDDADLTITGTGFRSTANVTIGAAPVFNFVFVSQNSLLLHWTGLTLPAGTYNVVYADDSGGSDTMLNAFTVT